MPNDPQILVVDDDLVLLRANVRLLERAGYQVIEAATGDEALCLTETHRPDLILLDVMLPDMNGLDVCRRIKKDPVLSETYIILLSGLKTFLDDEIAGLDEGADGYITRPVPNRELLARVRAALRFQQVGARLRENETRFRQLFENMPSGVAVYEAVDNGSDFVIKDFNRAGEQIEGVKRADLLGRRVTEVFPGVKEFGLFEVLQRVWQTGEAEFFPAAHYQDERNTGWRENYLDKLPSGEIVTIFNDVTRRKQTEEILRESEEKLRTLFDLLPVGISVLDKERTVLEDNPALQRILQISKEDLSKGKHVKRQYIRNDGSIMPAKEFPSIRAMNEQQIVENVEIGIIKEDGETIWASVSAVPVPFSDWDVVVTTTDITERKLTEKNLENALVETQRHEKEVSSLLEASRAVLEHQDFEPAAREIFEACKQLIGATGGYVALLSPEGDENEVLFLESGGLPCTVDPDLPMPIRGLRADAYYTGQVVYHNDFSNSEWVELMPTGHVALKNVMFVPLVLSEKTVGLMGLANKTNDFSENDALMASAFGELAAVALRNSHTLESLKSALHEKEILLQEIHHRVKNNFTIVSNLLGLQSEFIDDEKAQRAFEDSQNRILSMARIHEHLYQSHNVAHIDMAEYIRSLAEQLHSFHSIDSIDIIVDVEPGSIVMDLRSAIPCGLCINELITNALKYAFPGLTAYSLNEHETVEMGQDNQIRVKFYAKDEEHYALVVSDNGVGLPADFDWRNASSLGLLLVRMFAQQLKGTVTLDTDMGTAFCIIFPKPDVE